MVLLSFVPFVSFVVYSTSTIHDFMMLKPTTDQIDTAARRLATTLRDLHTLGLELEAAEAELNKRFAKKLSTLSAAAGDQTASLAALIEAAPEQFERPRTRAVDGLKFGLAKGPGGIVFENAERVCVLIHKHFPEDVAEALLHITERPNKEAIEKLTVCDLRKIGCEIKDAGDRVTIKMEDSAVDKRVKALLKNGASE